LDAYKSCAGKGYARLDIRMETSTGKLYMLEVNAQCGLSEDENYTSIGAILKVSGRSFTEIIAEILKDALRRSVAKPVEKRVRVSKTKKTVAVK
jgi:D-alanine-D-alanine ligase